MSRAAFALYKGPPNDDWWHWVCHYVIRLRNLDKWSHAELVVDGICHAASPRDGGVRAKKIDLTTGRWDVVSAPLTDAQCDVAVQWFKDHDGDEYDWAGIWRFALPFLPHSRRRRFCFESIGDALGWGGTYKLAAKDFYTWATTQEAADGN